MSLIIPYEEKLNSKNGAFINQNGEISFTYAGHERFASDFCNGKNYQFLSERKYGSDLSYDSYFEELKKY